MTAELPYDPVVADLLELHASGIRLSYDQLETLVTHYSRLITPGAPHVHRSAPGSFHPWLITLDHETLEPLVSYGLNYEGPAIFTRPLTIWLSRFTPTIPPMQG